MLSQWFSFWIARDGSLSAAQKSFKQELVPVESQILNSLADPQL